VIGNQLVNATATIFTDHAGFYGRLRLFRHGAYRSGAGLRGAPQDVQPRRPGAQHPRRNLAGDRTDAGSGDRRDHHRGSRLARVGEIIARNAELYKKLEAAHFRALLGGKLDGAYAESCRHTVAQEAAIGLDARVRSTAGSYVLQAALDALARKYWFSAAKVAERGRVISQAISFDVANAMTLHRQAAEQASAARRGAIDDAIAEFAGAIGEVVEAIKEASGSLTTTCSTLN
jgi:hypothetical protein